MKKGYIISVAIIIIGFTALYYFFTTKKGRLLMFISILIILLGIFWRPLYKAVQSYFQNKGVQTVVAIDNLNDPVVMDERRNPTVTITGPIEPPPRNNDPVDGPIVILPPSNDNGSGRQSTRNR